MKTLRSTIIALLVTTATGGSAWAEPMDDQLHLLAHKIIAISNRMRKENGARPVAALEYLCEAARGHSQEMMSKDYFNHVSPTPGRERVKNRVELSGGWDMTLAENIFRAEGIPLDEIAEETVDAWMHSPHHRANLLNPEYNSMGVGIVKVGKDKWTVTQVFALQTVSLDSYRATPAGGGYDVTLKGRVVEGPGEGEVYFGEEMMNKWGHRAFESSFKVKADGTLSIGQDQPDGKSSVELEFPVSAKVYTGGRADVPPDASPGGKKVDRKTGKRVDTQ